MKTLGLTHFFSRQREGHDVICLEMISSFRFGESSETGEKVMLCNFGRILCETSRQTMHDVFGFHNSEHDVGFPLDNFNYNEARYELTGCNNFQSSRTSCAFLHDDALLLLHQFLPFNISGEIEGSKVNDLECYLLWAAKHNVQVCVSSFIWA